MSKLLSDKWDNAFLNEMTQEGLMYCRRSRLNVTKSEVEEIEFFRSNAFFLVDHPALQNLNADVISVEANNRQLVFMNKTALVNELNKYDLPDTSDIIVKVSEYVGKVGKNAMSGQNVLNVSNEDFTKLLKGANLDNVVEILDLERNNVKSKLTM